MSTRGRPVRYQALADFLASSAAHEVTLTFREIEGIIRRPLPETAVLHAAWWSNPSRAHTQLLQALGWRAHADRDHLRVVFTREGQEE